MSKDHSPSDFSRQSGYKSDLEIAETSSKAKTINTSFGSKNHNSYVMRTDGHEHFWYEPSTRKSGWHGYNYKTKSNHPTEESLKSAKKMSNNEKRNEFLNSLKVEKSTKQNSENISRNNVKCQTVHGGCEIGDEGPGGHGRNADYKGGYTPASSSAKQGQNAGLHGHSTNGFSGNSSSAEGHSSNGHSGKGGH